MNLREGETVKKGKSSKQIFSVSGLILSVAGIFSGSQKEVPAAAENGSVFDENRIARIESAQNRENQDPLNSPDRKSSRREKSVLELIKLDFNQHRKAATIVGAIVLILSAVFFYNYMRAGVVLLSLAFMGAISRVWQRFFPLEFGIEFVMLATVISGFTYGAFAGAAVGLISLVASTLLTQEDPGKMWPAFLAISVIGFLAGTLSFANLALWGVIFTVIYDAIISVIYISSGHSAIKTLMFDATHIAFNYFVFYHIAPVLVSIIA